MESVHPSHGVKEIQGLFHIQGDFLQPLASCKTQKESTPNECIASARIAEVFDSSCYNLQFKMSLDMPLLTAFMNWGCMVRSLLPSDSHWLNIACLLIVFYPIICLIANGCPIIILCGHDHFPIS